MPANQWQRFQAGRLLKQALKAEPVNRQLELLKRAVTLDPNLKEAHRRLLALGQKASLWPELEAYYLELAQQHPTVAMIRNYWGVLFYLSGRPEEAQAKFQEAKQLDPTYVAARNNLAMLSGAYYSRYNDAIAEYEQTLQIEPDNVVAHGNLGQQYQQVGRLDEALVHLKRAVELAPSGYNMTSLANYYFYKGDTEAAEKWYSKALTRERDSLALDHERLGARLNLSRCYIELQRYQDAVDTVHESFRLPGAHESVGLHKALGQAYSALGDVEHAIIHLEKALALAADNEMAQGAIYRALAQVYYKTGDYHKAGAAHQLSSIGRYDLVSGEERSQLIVQGRELAKAMVERPHDASLRLEYGRNLYYQGRWEEAQRELHEALHLQRDLAEAHYLISWISILMDNPVEAWHHVFFTTYYDPQGDSSYVLTGVAALYEGEYERAAMSLKRALLLNPRNAQAQNYLGDVYQYEHQYQEAMNCFQRALEIMPEFHAARYNLGHTLYRLGQFEAAQEHIRRLVSAQPTHLMGWRLLGDIQIEMGRFELAQATLQRAMAINPYCLPVQEKLAELQKRQQAAE
ncbi:MAG: tetratricopeptide repeat protein [Bacillota bacterium]